MRLRAPRTVSVVIPTLNRCDSLRRTLEGLREQTYAPFEVIVVNGPSTDGTEELLALYPVRAGSCAAANAAAARNEGVRIAAGDLLLFVDDDAVPARDWVELLVAAYDDRRVMGAGGPVFNVALREVEWRLCTCTRDGVPDTASEPPVDRYLGRGADPFVYLAGCNMSFRRSALRRAGGFHETLATRYEDAEVCAHIVDAGGVIAYVEGALVYHDPRPSSLRDERQAVRDPYSATFGRAVFALQQAGEAALPALEAWLEDWRVEAGLQLRAGLLDEPGRDEFLRRAELGLADGIAAAASGRPRVTIGRADRRRFLPFE